MKTENLEIYLYDDIEADGEGWFGETIESETSAKSVHKQLDEVEPNTPISLHINSYGGDVKEGAAIYSLLKLHSGPVTVYVDGFACSAASLIAMAGDKVIMGKLAMMMIHNAWTVAAGNAKELRKAADDLDKISTTMSLAYKERCGDKLPEDKLQSMLDEEVWLDAEECVALGFADEIAGKSAAEGLAKAKAAAVSSFWKKVPQPTNAEAKNNAERLMRAFKKMEVVK